MLHEEFYAIMRLFLLEPSLFAGLGQEKVFLVCLLFAMLIEGRD